MSGVRSGVRQLERLAVQGGEAVPGRDFFVVVAATIARRTCEGLEESAGGYGYVRSLGGGLWCASECFATFEGAKAYLVNEAHQALRSARRDVQLAERRVELVGSLTEEDVR